MKNSRAKWWYGLLLGFVISSPSRAELDFAAGSAEKLYVSSQTAELNRTTGIGVYQVDVKIDQGPTHVTGDKVTTYADDSNKLKEILIEGSAENLAHYWTLIEPGKPELHAHAETIQFFPQKNYIVLIGSAKINQGPDEITGPRLEYDLDQQLLKSIDVQTASGDHSRTVIVIDPQANDKKVKL